MTSIMLALNVVRLVFDLEEQSEVPCPQCFAPLFLHQPDSQLPERLLATCDECRSWFLVHAAGGLMVQLPNEDVLRDA
jgi:hypothetical protein